MSHGPRTVRLERLVLPPDGMWARLPLIGGVVGLLGLAAAIGLGSGDTPTRLYHSLLVAALYCLSIALGSMFFVLIMHATKAGWGIALRRLAENAMWSVWVVGIVAIVTIGLGLHDLYHWSHADAVAHDPLLAGKSGWLNPAFFQIRAVLYVAIWSLLALWYSGNSARQDGTGDEKLSRKMIFWAGPAIALFALSLTFAAFDWIMSLDPHWYSTIFGVYYFAGALVGAFAFLVLLATGLERSGCLAEAVNDEHFHDLGKLLFAFTVFWAYIGFSQYFLIWYANIPEETVWYHHRAEGSWGTLTAFLAIGHFAVPFLFLMPRTIKRRRGLLALGAAWMLFMHYVDLYWLVMPNLAPHGAGASLVDVAAVVGVGGLFLGAVGWRMRRLALVPIRDPRLPESLSFENL